MAIAITIRDYLNSRNIPYETIPHRHTVTALGAARAARVDGEMTAKAVVLEDEDSYLVAVIPATHRLQIGQLDRLLQRRLGLATEAELGALFPDCELGAVPAVGRAYHLPTVVDDRLAELPDVYFEAGDHEALVHMNRGTFQVLMYDARHGRISAPLRAV